MKTFSLGLAPEILTPVPWEGRACFMFPLPGSMKKKETAEKVLALEEGYK